MNKDEAQDKINSICQELVEVLNSIMGEEKSPFSMLDLTIINPENEDAKVSFGVRLAPADSIAVAIIGDRMFAIMADDSKADMTGSEEARKKAVDSMLEDILKKGDKSNGTN